MAPFNESDERSLDLVQRLIISALVGVVVGGPTIALAGYSVYGDEVEGPARIGLCVLSALVGLLGAAAIQVINRRRPYAPGVVIGLLPAAVALFVILR